MDQYHQIYAILSKPVDSEKMEKAIALGMVKKEELEDGALYEGHCRNASISRWNKQSNKFTYLRHKFGSSFFEDIVYPSDDEGFDIFVPFRKISWDVLKQDVESLDKQVSSMEAKSAQRAYKQLANLVVSLSEVSELKESELEIIAKTIPFMFEKSQIKILKTLNEMLHNNTGDTQAKVASIMFFASQSHDPSEIKSLFNLKKENFPNTVPSPVAQLLRTYAI